MAFVPFARTTYAIDDAWMGNAFDDDGCQWLVGKQTILKGPTMKTRIKEQTSRDGGYRRKSYKNTAYRWLKGVCVAPDQIKREIAEDRLRSLLADGEQHDFVLNTPWKERTARVEQDGELQLETLPDGCSFEWQMNLAFADPRWLYPIAPHSVPLLPPVEGTGLDWTGSGLGGLDWTGSGLGGLNWGTASTTGTLVITNAGSEKTWPVIRLDGALAAGATVRLAETGQVYTFGPALATGDFLEIDSNPNHRSVVLNGVADRMSSMIAQQWFEIPARSSITLVLAATGTGSLSATWYDADVM